MRAKLFSRIISTALGVFLAAGMGVVAGVAVVVADKPVAAHASTVGGPITRSEVLARAQWWINTYGVIYSQNQANQKPDPDGHRYRPDCSGFVSMAWHLPKKSDGWDRYTGDLAAFGDTTWLGSLDQLQPGDAILGVSYGHVALFDRWANSSRTQMWIYDEFSSSAEGRHAVKDKSWYQANGFRGLRYNKIVNDGGGRAAGSPVSAADFTGDGKADLTAQYSNGQLRTFASTGNLSADRQLFGANALVGEGWQTPGVERILTADFNGDNKADIAAQYSNGQLRAWAGTGNLSADGQLFAGNGVLVGEGWHSSIVERILTADFTGDGKDDIAAQYTSGQLRVWASTGNLSADALLFGTTALVGEGWQSSNVERILVADFNGDNKSDMAAQYANGQMRAWAGTGSLSADYQMYAGAGVLVGEGWQPSVVERILLGDFTGDNKDDIGAQYTNGQVRVWASTGNLSADRLLFGTTALVGEGWQSPGVQRIL